MVNVRPYAVVFEPEMKRKEKKNWNLNALKIILGILMAVVSLAFAEFFLSLGVLGVLTAVVIFLIGMALILKS